MKALMGSMATAIIVLASLPASGALRSDGDQFVSRIQHQIPRISTPELIDACERGSPTVVPEIRSIEFSTIMANQMMCTGYISAVADFLLTAAVYRQVICIPNVPGADLNRAFLRFAATHPELREGTAVEAVRQALTIEYPYPCQ